MVGVLLLFMSWVLLTSFIEAKEWLPDIYSGDTPYKGMSFGTTNVTIPLRTQRDIALNVTIDQGLWPAIDLKSYFGTDYSTQRLGNIEKVLYMGYRRLVLDLYWNPNQSVWQMCPEAMTSSINKAGPDVQIKQYRCSTDFTFYDFMTAIRRYLTANNLSMASYNTDLVFLILNLNPLPGEEDTSPTPNIGNRLRDIVQQSMRGSDLLYTPRNLRWDRLRHHTASGTSWPVWISLIERGYELLVGFGTNNLHGYNVSAETDIIFSSDVIGGVMMQNNLTQCPIYHNQTWPFLTDNVTISNHSVSNTSSFNFQTSLEAVRCGYSPYFRASNYSTVNSTYSANDTAHWADNILSTIWSWDVYEPRTVSNPYCAMMQSWNGRWQAGDCTQLLRVSCRSFNDTNEWVLTTSYVSYDRAFTACPDGYFFDSPKISRDNTMLFNAIQLETSRSQPPKNDHSEIEHHLFWINLNSGTDGSCWVVGRYTKCWWLNENTQQYQRLIKTSAVAGVIILLLVAVFLWLKCARWWRQRKARIRKHFVKRLLARGEYVTVPA